MTMSQCSFTSVTGGVQVKPIHPQSVGSNEASSRNICGKNIGRSSLGKLGYAISKLQGAKNIGMPGRPLFQMSEGVSASILEQFSQAMAAAATEAQIQVDPGVGKS